MQYTLFLILAPVAAVIAIGVTLYASRNRATSDMPALIWLMVSAVGWLICNTLELLSPSPAATLAWGKMTYLFTIATPVAWLFFAMQYSGAWAGLSRARISGFLLIPATVALLVLTNERHGLIWRSYELVPVGRWLALRVEYGPWFWVMVTYGYALLVLGSLLFIRQSGQAQPLFRSQSGWLAFGSLIPIGFNLVQVFHLVPGLEKDFTAVGFAVSGIAFSLGIIQHRLFDLRPIARTALIDNMRDAMIAVDDKGRVVDFNPAAHNLIAQLDGRLAKSELLGRNFPDLLRTWPELLGRLGSSGALDADVELPLGDMRRSYECRVVPIDAGRGRGMARLIVLHDITERKATEATLRHSMAELQSSNEQLDAFAHTVAHDLKDPLNTLVGYSELLESYWDRLSREEIEVSLATMRQTGGQMSRIIDALLLLSRTYRLDDIALDVINMQVVVDEAVSRVKASTEMRGLELVMPETWPWVVGYAPWIVEVWVNYLSNAAKYGEAGSQIELGYDVVSDASGVVSSGDARIRFWVRDRGPGLTPEQQALLFRPFVRFHPTRGEGTGLGLTIVQRIVAKLGGEVGVESEPGRGSTFWFSLPITGDETSACELLDEEVG